MKKNWKRILIESAFLPFVIFVFAPIDNYLLAPTDYNFSLANVFVYFFILFLISWLILATLLFLTPELGRGYVASLLFFLGITLYIQGNFLNNNYGTLGGQTIDWSRFATRGVISVLSVIICFVVVTTFVVIFRKKDFEKVIAVICCILMGMQLFTCMAEIVLKREWILFTYNESIITTQDGMFELSSTSNTIVFVVDSLDTRDVYDILGTDIDFIDTFEDFTFFDDCVSVSGVTIVSVPYILTGEMYLNEQPINDYAREGYYNSALLEVLIENNYDIGIYSPQGTLRLGFDKEELNGDYYTNVKFLKREAVSFSNFIQIYGKLIAFKYLPQPLKQNFLITSKDLQNLIAVQGDYTPYILDDPAFFNNLQASGISISTDRPVFRMYHIWGAHTPYTMNENGEYVPDGVYRSTQIRGSFKIIEEYINELKELGIYDQTNIVIIADHGSFGARLSSAVLIKRAGENHPFEINSNPVSYYDHLENTLISLINPNNDFSGTMYDTVTDTTITRRAWLPLLKQMANGNGFYYNLFEINVIEIENNQRIAIFTGETYPSSGVGYPCDFNQRIDSDFCNVGMIGFALGDNQTIKTYGDFIVFPLELKTLPSENIKLTVSLDDVYQFPASAVLCINGNIVGRAEVDPITNTMTFIIPNEYITDKTVGIQLLPDVFGLLENINPDAFFTYAINYIILEETTDEPTSNLISSSYTTMNLGFSEKNNVQFSENDIILQSNSYLKSWSLILPIGTYELVISGSGIENIETQILYSPEGDNVSPPILSSMHSDNTYIQQFEIDRDLRKVVFILSSTADDVTIEEFSLRKID